MFACTLREAGARAGGHAEAGGGDSEGADILLGLEQDDVDLRSEEAAQHHWAAQADGDAHGGGLNLEEDRGFTNKVSGRSSSGGPDDVLKKWNHASSLTRGSPEEGGAS